MTLPMKSINGRKANTVKILDKTINEKDYTLRSCPRCGKGKSISRKFEDHQDEFGVFGVRDMVCRDIQCGAEWQEHYDLREVFMLKEPMRGI